MNSPGGNGGFGGWLSALMGGGKGAGGDSKGGNMRQEGSRGEEESVPFWQLTRIETDEVSLMVEGGVHHPYRRVAPSGPLLVAIREDIGTRHIRWSAHGYRESDTNSEKREKQWFPDFFVPQPLEIPISALRHRSDL